MATPEGTIQNAICEYLEYKHKNNDDVLFWRNNNNPIFDKKRGVVRSMPKYAMNGTPDIIVIWRGQFVGLEVKTSKGRQSQSQKEFEKKCKATGAEYYVVRSIEDVQEIGL